MGVQAATARRAAKRQRSIDEQKKIDSEQEASRKAAEAAGGGEDEWASNFKLLLQYKGEQGRKWLGVVPKKLKIDGKGIGQWAKRQRQLQARSQLSQEREQQLRDTGFKFGEDAVKLLVATSVAGEIVKPPPREDQRKQPKAAAVPKKRKDELPSERMARKKAEKRAARLAQSGHGRGDEGSWESKQQKTRHRGQGDESRPSIDVFALGLRELAQSGEDGLLAGTGVRGEGKERGGGCEGKRKRDGEGEVDKKKKRRDERRQKKKEHHS